MHKQPTTPPNADDQALQRNEHDWHRERAYDDAVSPQAVTAEGDRPFPDRPQGAADDRYGGYGGLREPAAGTSETPRPATHGDDAVERKSALGDSAVDREYMQWRNEQLRKFDEEYRSWRGEGAGKSSEDFEQWRNQREPGASDASKGAASKPPTTDDSSEKAA